MYVNKKESYGISIYEMGRSRFVFLNVIVCFIHEGKRHVQG